MYLYTSESVSPGHPDKCADIIADRIVDELLKLDKNARVATEVFVVGKNVIIGGEVKIDKNIDKNFYINCAKEALKYIGYPEKGFSENETIFPEDLNYEVYISRQSPEISIGVDKEGEIGAGDQGMMIGFATDEREDFMPAALMMARELRDILYNNAKLNPHIFGIDLKTEVVLDYESKENFDKNIPKRVDKIIIAQSHSKDFNEEDIRKNLKELIFKQASFTDMIDEKTEFFINGTGKFVIHGPIADSGLTGRKVVADTYGAYAPVGGGAQSSKDYTKVDRSGLYAARWIAKHIVAAGLAKKAVVEISYVIGIAKPLSVTVNTLGTSKTKLKDEELSDLIKNRFPLTPLWITKKFGLDEPIKNGFTYVQTAARGQVGYEEYPWEKLDELEWFKSLP
ncbi:methionine adenosyltransferase [Nitrosophilus kaiyonis]|uniref:methionine adenosyltransferase n=1 Tax=Nitrosophilus kaiyonis TaxID=2930200 RepID=UPI0024934B43|nr:methionine adenosyltransferase [Nitrosophilus kaiyonis]